ncbi:MAG: acetate--CoA ligase [Deltaproteobacteria bacterium]|nr:acetate--CoA ligase [Deltaproteobacteria bacterium]
MSNDYNLQLRNQVSGIKQLCEKMDAFGKLHGLSNSLIYGANLAIEELFVNIVSHAYADGREHIIGIGLSLTGKKLTITIEDDGKEFDPTTIPSKPTERISLDDIEDMELGLRMVRKVVDAITYERRHGQNRVALVMHDIPNKKTITSVVREDRVFPPLEAFREKARLGSTDEYQKIYQRSIDDPEAFWSQLANELDWFKKWDKVLVENFREGVHKWFVGGKLNLTVNCLDRHLITGRRNKAALIWEGDRPGEEKTLTFQQLHRQVCRFANVLKKHGVQKGDRVIIYLPMIAELPIAMLACARIGAVHSVVFAGIGPEALKNRILDSNSRLLICASGCSAGGKPVRSKEQADIALLSCPGITDVIVVRRPGMESSMSEGRDFWWDEEIGAPDILSECSPEMMDAEAPLFIHYTGAVTDKPMGLLHTTAGYLVYVMQTFKWIFDIQEQDIFWCTADIGWDAGHGYTVYGPLVNGATSLLFEGGPDHPYPDRFWEIVEKYGVTIFYSGAKTLRTLMKSGNHRPERHDLNTLRLLGSTGSPIDPKLWMWYRDAIGQGKCPIVETWWQAETGGIVISPFPGATPCKPGAAALPFFGIEPEIIRDNPGQTALDEDGRLVINRPWPGLMRSIYGAPGRFKKIHFSNSPWTYATGHRAKIDTDGYFWMTDRNDVDMATPKHGPGTAEADVFPISQPFFVEAVDAAMGSPGGEKDIRTFMTLKMDTLKRDDLISAFRNQRRAQAAYRETSPHNPTVTSRA